jgi:hypothetical protein
MTANELADAIEKGGKDGFFQDEIIAILRQQQAEIESLKLRELTDAEIEAFEHLIAKAFDFSTQIKVVGLDRIIRAIIKKASEK